MKRRTRNLLIGALSVALALSLGALAVIQYRYWRTNRDYEQTVEQFVTVRPTVPPRDTHPDQTQPSPSVPDVPSEPAGSPEETEPPAPPELAPIIVDFESLQEVNSDVVGWIYCEETVINYPVLQSGDNVKYLRRLYTGKYATGGSIFVDGINRRNFRDAVSILYGHKMRNGTMFGTLMYWGDQAYLDEHPVFWLLTPEQDYRIDVLGCATVSAYSDAYTVYQEPGEALDRFMADKLSQLEVSSSVVPEAGSRYVIMSTCSYVYEDARFILYGLLVPVDSAAGILIE